MMLVGSEVMKLYPTESISMMKETPTEQSGNKHRTLLRSW